MQYAHINAIQTQVDSEGHGMVVENFSPVQYCQSKWKQILLNTYPPSAGLGKFAALPVCAEVWNGKH